MIKSIFRMIWFRKKQNVLLIIELFFAFVVLFALLCNVTNNIINYREPLGFDYNDIIVLNLEIWSSTTNEEENSEIIDQLKRNISAMPEVISLTNSTSNIPYSQSTYSSYLKYGDRNCGNPNKVKTDDNFQEVLSIAVNEGKWFDVSDEGSKEIPIVINKELKDILFENEPAVGKVIHSGMYKVVGVVNSYKIKGELNKKLPVYFTRFKPNEFEEFFLLKVKRGTKIDFEARLMKSASSIAKDWTARIEPLTKYRSDNFRRKWIPIVIFSIICLFFIINIVLGLYGILWYNISKRKSEIGLRQSIGASKNKIYQQFIFEILVIATLGIIPGIIVAIQFPVLKVFDVETSVYIIAMVVTIVLIYLLVVISALLPSAQATKIQPAIALHEE